MYEIHANLKGKEYAILAVSKQVRKRRTKRRMRVCLTRMVRDNEV